MAAGRAPYSAVVSVLLVVGGVACNAVFDITEGTPRPDGEAGQPGGEGNPATGGVGALPKGGAAGKGGVASGGAAGLGMGGTSSGGGGAGGDGATGGGSGATGGTGGDSAGSGQGMGGTSENGGTGGDTSGTGGDSSGTGGTGGSTGGTGGDTSGTGGGGNPPTTIVELMGYLIWPRCSQDTAVYSATCNFFGEEGGPTSCPNQDKPFEERGAFLNATLQIGGTVDVTYNVLFHVFGAVTNRCYTGGAWEDPDDQSPTWYIGGKPTDSDWTSYELHVKNANGQEVGRHYLNGSTSANNPNIPDCETGGMQQLNEDVYLDLPGGGRVEVVVHDADCAMNTNCGMEPETSCGPWGANMAYPAPYEKTGSMWSPRDTRYASTAAQFSQFIQLEIQSVSSGN